MSSLEFEDQLVELSEWRNQHLFGKYRGTVDAVEEGDDLGIISVKVPDVFGKDFVLERVRPCSPFAGSKHGFVAIPESGDGVWVEFEAGKTSLPIWTGFWWAEGEIPEPKGPLVRSFITTNGHKLILDDDGNEVKVLHADGAEMTMTDSDITIKIGDSSITLSSSEIALKVGAAATAPVIKISSSEISLKTGSTGVIAISTSGVDIGNGALKTS